MRFFSSIPGRTALILTVITIAWTLIEHLLGYNTTNHEIGQYTRMVIPFVYYIGIGIAVAQKRRKEHHTLSFAEGLRTGLAVTVVFSIAFTLWMALYAEVINPDYQETLIAFEKEKLVAQGASEAEMESELTEVRMNSGGTLTSYIYLFAFMATAGVVVSLLAALVLRKAGPRTKMEQDL